MNDTFNEYGATLKYGTVSASRPGFARVRLLDTDNMRTMWLPILYPKTQDDACYWTYDEGEQVALLLDAQGEDGVILGAIFSGQDTPPVTSSDKFGVRFKDGAELEYDRASHTLVVRGGVKKVVIEATETILLKAGAKVTIDTPEAESTGNFVVKGKFTAEGGASVKGDVGITGNLSADGTVMDAGGNSNHHSH